MKLHTFSLVGARIFTLITILYAALSNKGHPAYLQIGHMTVVFFVKNNGQLRVLSIEPVIKEYPIHMSIRVFIVALILLAFGILSPAHANPPPLPAVPSNSILQQVIADARQRAANGEGAYVPLGAPLAAMTALAGFGAQLDGVENLVAPKEAVNYLATGGILKETVIPLKASGSKKLAPNMTTHDGKRGQIVGALHQPYRGTMVLVVIFKWSKLDKIRMYYKNKNFYEYSVYGGTFPSPVAGTFDEGGLISHKLTCVTVGSKQVCWEPNNYSAVREEPYPKDLISDAYRRAKETYDLNNDFFLDDALPDLIGTTVRGSCAGQLVSGGGSACDPNVYFSAAKKVLNNLIAIFVVDSAADIISYTDEGVYLGSLPAGDYLVMNATPNVVTPGQTGVLYLININDPNNHFLIPGVRMQQHAQSSLFQKPVASIKDGCIWYFGFGFVSRR